MFHNNCFLYQVQATAYVGYPIGCIHPCECAEQYKSYQNLSLSTVPIINNSGMVKINISTVRCANVLALHPVIPSCLSAIAASTFSCSSAHWVCTVLLSEVAEQVCHRAAPKAKYPIHTINEFKITCVSAPVIRIDSDSGENWASIYSVILLTKRKTNQTENFNFLVEVI